MVPDHVCGACGAPLAGQRAGAPCACCLLRLGLESEPELPAPGVPDLQALTRRLATPLGVQFYRLGDYELEGELARGGMGLVFRAWRSRLQRHVALKVMLPDELGSSEQVRRFRLEAEATARLDHPNIVPIYEVGEEGGQHFLCMKLIQGGTLAQALAKGRFAPRRAGEFMAALAEAIHYAHERGVLHRDLKPGNILVDERGQPQVTDFGLARLLEREQDLTRPNAVLGTPAYMSPEQAAGRTSELTIASDLYSLGAILYELLTGRPPFRAESMLEVLRQVRECDPPPPRALDPSVPPDLDTICRKCLHKEPRQRYATAQALAEDLRRWLRGDPVLARPLTPLFRAVRWCRRNPTVTVLLGALVILLWLLTGAALYERRRVLEDNQAFAGLVVVGFESSLASVGRHVEQAAADLRHRLLSSERHLPGSSYTNELRLLANRSLEGVGAWAALTNWVLMDGHGQTLGRWPEVPKEARLLDRSGRDYFRGAIRAYQRSGRASHYVSEAYDSVEDGLRKIGVSVILPGAAPGEPMGVLTAMVRTTSEALSTAFQIPRHEIVLLSRQDPNPTTVNGGWEQGRSSPLWVVHLHPLDRPGRTNVTRFPPRWVGRTNLTFYFDPARGSHPIEAWMPWLAGLASVGKSVPGSPPKFIILVQSRDWIILFLVPVLVLATILLGVAGWRAWRAEQRQRRSESQVSRAD